jgi:hypothetical protein
MKASFFNSPTLFVEISQTTFKALHGDDGLEFSLDRHENGRLMPDCIERLTSSLRVFLKRGPWQLRTRAVCAIGARGVSIRRMVLPACPKDELERLLVLQIEREFPLAPCEMAWGYRLVSGSDPPRNGAPTNQELLVVAVKREVIDDYSKILVDCGLEPVFTIGALARSALCASAPASYSVLDVTPSHSELVSFENGVPTAIRAFPWGSQEMDRRMATDGADLEALSIPSKLIGQKLYFTSSVPAQMQSRFAGGAEWESIPAATGEGRSPAILGLRKSFEDNGSNPIQLRTALEAKQSASPVTWKWATAALLLGVAALALRYAEVFVHRPGLVRKIAEVKSYREKLPNLDRELSFLQFLKTNQPPYFDPLSAIAGAAPSGTRIDALSMNRRGDVSIRATMRDSQQVVQFRSRLLDSGVFGDIVVEEQNPTPDRQKMIVRMTGRWSVPAGGKPPPRSTPQDATQVSPQTEPIVPSAGLSGSPAALPVAAPAVGRESP